jgi:hypothetical protein
MHPAAFRKVVGYLVRLQKAFLLEFRAKRGYYERALQAYHAARQRAEEEHVDPPEPPVRPVLQRLVCGDTALEAMAEVLEDNPRGTLVVRDDLDGWLGPFTRPGGKRGSRDVGAWLLMQRAEMLLFDRKGGRRRYCWVSRAAVSVTGLLSTDVFARALTPGLPAAGLAACLLVALPPQGPASWTEAAVDPEVEQAYDGLILSLSALDFEPGPGDKEPRVLTLSPEARAAWAAFYDDRERASADEQGWLAAALARLAAYAARFALIHHVAEHRGRRESDLVPVGPDSIAAGVALYRWCCAETRRVRAILFESAEERAARRLVEVIRARGGSITARGLMRYNGRRYPDTASAEADLNTLVHLGLARWAEGDCQNGTGAGGKCDFANAT